MQSYIRLTDVSLDFPIYQGANRSLKKNLIWRGTGGSVANDANRRILVKALANVTLDIEHGARVGLIGHNGAGKTTLLRVMAGVYEPHAGTVEVGGHVSPLFDIGLGMDRDATGLDNIMLRGLFLGISRREIQAKLDSIAEFTELGPFLDMPLRTYSSGMMIRLAFAVSTSFSSEILLIDEAILAGDRGFLDKAKRRLAGFVDDSSILVLASHSAEFLREWCNVGVYMRAGSVVATGPIEEMLETYYRDLAQRASAA